MTDVPRPGDLVALKDWTGPNPKVGFVIGPVLSSYRIPYAKSWVRWQGGPGNRDGVAEPNCGLRVTASPTPFLLYRCTTCQKTWAHRTPGLTHNARTCRDWRRQTCPNPACPSEFKGRGLDVRPAEPWFRRTQTIMIWFYADGETAVKASRLSWYEFCGAVDRGGQRELRHREAVPLDLDYFWDGQPDPNPWRHLGERGDEKAGAERREDCAGITIGEGSPT